MKKLFRILGIALLVLIAILLFNTFTLSSKQVAAGEIEAVELPADIYENLSGAIQFETVSYSETAIPDSTAFFGLHRYLDTIFPLIRQNLELEKIGTYSLLYKWEGSNPSLKPMILMSHMDVVPVDEPTKDQWEAGAFSGKITDDYIIGRGTLDDKGTLVAAMEAVEKLMEENFKPKRTLYLAFGHDEEVGGPNGALAIANYLKAKGVQAAITIDEGGFLAENLVPGIEGDVAIINVAEKGFASFRLIVETNGGHSSAPPEENTIGMLAQAIVDLEDNQRPYKMVSPVDYNIEYLAPELPFKQRVAMANPWLFKGPVLKALNSHTTTAPTIIEGGVKNNVIPTVAEATINFRILPGETIESVQEHIESTISDKVRVEPVGFLTNPSPVSSVESENFMILQQTIRDMYPESIVVPGLVGGGTDARYFYDISDDVYRFYPIRLGPDSMGRFHGIDEKISKENYKEIIEFTYHMIKRFN